MPLPKLLGAKVLAVALAFATVPAAIPASVPVVGVSTAQADPYFRHGGRGYYGGPRHFRGGYYGPRHHYRGGWGHRGYGPRYYRHRGGDGAALAAGIIGLGVGAAIASAAQPRYYDTPRYAAPRYVAPRHAAPRYVRYAAAPWTPEWYQYCASRYRSFDARSGTFQPYHGPRRLCR